MGRCFSLNTHPEEGITSLDDWKGKWLAPGSYIVNEYGDRVTPGEMLKTITKRGQLRRAKVGYGSCIGHGEGSWDLFRGEFS